MYNFKLHGVKKKHERKLTSATLYTLAVIIIKFNKVTL